MKTVRGRTAAITGAGSGIGRALATLLAKQGCNVAVSDIDAWTMNETADEATRHNVEVHRARVDVSSRTQVHDWAADVTRELGSVHIVINNAGVALGATIEDTRYEDFEWLMNTNFWGVVHGTKAFLPHLRAAGEGHIVNISSLFGLIGAPTQGAYNASKFAVRGFTEALRLELEVEQSPICVTCVHPGGIKTNIARNARYTLRDGWVSREIQDEAERMFSTSADDAAAQILEAILARRPMQLIGRDAFVLDALQRLAPRLYSYLVVRHGRRRRRDMLAPSAVRSWSDG